MMLQDILTPKIQEAVEANFEQKIDKIEFQATRKDFEGDITMVVFPLLKIIKGNPVAIGNTIGEYLVQHVDIVEKFNVVQGFLNIVIADEYFTDIFREAYQNASFGNHRPEEEKAVMVEYSSPNTNKPLHLGHIRNNLLGYSVAEILKANGNKVYKTQIINDRGIHICKSMLAWQKFGNGETPESTGLKGDKLVGNYYVVFDKEYKKEIEQLVAGGMTEDEAKKQAPLMIEAQEMLRKWEAGDKEVVALWEKMNQWVYDGFEETYANLGVDFDSYYYESNTYLLGKDVVEEGLHKGIFYKKDDGSVWIDLTDEGLDEKLVLRADGTSVYITQDIGTAIQRVKDYQDITGMVYTVGNEQDYHFKVLFLILQKLGYDWAKHLHHLSYGMVDLPSGKMKSREGTVVDADDLMHEMTETAREISEELGKLDGMSEDEKNKLYRTIGMGALKYYILKVDPKKRILFDPKESVDFNGNTGPFIQYTYARIQSILRKSGFDYSREIYNGELEPKEKDLIKKMLEFPAVIELAGNTFSPAVIANYTYDLVKEYNSFYQSVSILGETDAGKKAFRVQLSDKIGQIIQKAFALLGIEVPERM
ncbi:arginine--tRNA ligase [Avrilella dinanensis]|uniref:Arginine--tRNA ligase n=1 Tax=Avrilella dinanensis TaxID=2008672 RepID=A0A2M9R5C3_9FLAO|nr:arginine--tRNA ligase [Avrilella dinanensis]PJR03975.1 arginine--tRNA ligase [Avrilella dinanensis]